MAPTSSSPRLRCTCDGVQTGLPTGYSIVNGCVTNGLSLPWTVNDCVHYVTWVTRPLTRGKLSDDGNRYREPDQPVREPPHAARQPGPDRHRLRAADGRARRDDREHRTAEHPPGPWILRDQPGVGPQRLHADLRRSAAAGRPRR